MFDEMNLLRENEPLQRLLGHYVALDHATPEAWHTRLTELAEIGADALVELHGHLLAHGWLAMNLQADAGGYRVTTNGARALRRAQAPAGDEEEPVNIEMESAWKKARGKRKKDAA
ncbi:MAG: hypothetical protein AB7K24_23860 [Gemmataceae bacterium]